MMYGRSSTNWLISSIPSANRRACCSGQTCPSNQSCANVDESLLKQALLNLMINGVQAMESESTDRPGEMMVRLENDNEEIRIHVIDHGPGIEESRLDEVFHPYVSSKPGGTGLGLPTTRRIVEVHGGRIALHSKLGAGSDFTIHLPKAPPDDDT